ncbi:sensor histidine kinase [Halobacillus salinarum]|uniref:histidine kinase n=1 Tax=Halobacillus salinarum TaxID=2932257 RepID=A0ABY4EMB0_9BACI|nr:sensor histidine kinase [Halobacillus salinarum]UOQ44789.1 sensor histidine kinase [Halobacillus salinarum]
MKNWYHVIPKHTGLSSYIWIIFYLLPFFFIFKSSSFVEILLGISMVLLFFVLYQLSSQTKHAGKYVWVSLAMLISLGMTVLFGYIYFSLFLVFIIGNIENRAGFLSLYIVHLTTTIAAFILVFLVQHESLFPQLPFIIINLIGVILLPFTIRYRNKQHELEGELEDANQKISQLMVIEERERIARDLHDTLGQKLSLIGLKSDLAGKLVHVKPESCAKEIQDIQVTARTALKEVREMVSNMSRSKLEDELVRVQQMIEAAEMDFYKEGSAELSHTPLLVENVLSMCLKEAVTNIVKHSKAGHCRVEIHQCAEEVTILVEDDGTGMKDTADSLHGHGLQGMKERLEFVNGRLKIQTSSAGTSLHISVPKIVQQEKGEKIE